MRWRPDRIRLARRMVDLFADGGMPWPDVAVAALAVRGATGLDQVRFAGSVGLGVSELADVEAGRCAARDLPAAIASDEPFIRTLTALRSFRPGPRPRPGVVP